MSAVLGGLPADQMLELLRWICWLSLGTWLALPLAARLWQGPGTWIFARLLAWAVMGWLPWALAALHLVPLQPAAPMGIIALALLRLWLGERLWLGRGADTAAGAARREVIEAEGPDSQAFQPEYPLGRAAPSTIRAWLLQEVAFALLLWLGLAMRLGFADLSGLEKFTDMGFLAAVMRAEFMPPEDAWFAGEGLNYYYLGQAMVGVFGHLAGVSAQHSYQLGMATLFALTGLGSFALVYNFAAPWGRRIAAVLAGFAVPVVLWGGNFHSVLYTLARPWMGSTKPEYYFPDSTRYIGFDPPTDDKAFTEFPAYGFAVGDLHAHVAALPLFLLGIMLLAAMLRRGLAGKRADWRQVALFGWVLGLVAGANSWDLVVLGTGAILAAAMIAARPGLSLAVRLDDLGAAMILAAFVALASAAPFLASFKAFSEGIGLAPAQTPLWQLLVVYFHILPALVLLVLAALLLRPGDRVLPIVWLFGLGLLLVALPELIVVEDIYGDDFARANTMFKLTFRAQQLLVLAALAALAPLVRAGGIWLLGALVAAAPIVATLAYLPHVIRPPSVIRSLDGYGFLGEERALVEAAARLPLAPGEALVEAAGESFTETSRVSAMTGLPTVIGWTGHEWLWRGTPDSVHARASAVTRFYTEADRAERCTFIRRHNLRYVILGEVEQRRYPTVDRDGLRSLGTIIWQGNAGEILQIDRNLCQTTTSPPQ